MRRRPIARALVSMARGYPLLAFGLIGISALVAVGVFAASLAPTDPLAINPASVLQPPGPEHPFGTDRFGRDVLSRLIYGTRVSLGTATASIAMAILVGVLVGLASGFRGGWIDQGLMRVMDVMFAVPALLLAIAIAASIGPSTVNAAFAIAVIYVPIFARVTRGAVLAEVAKEYVDASRVIGVGDSRILLRHILPNSLTPIVVQASLALAAAIIIESGLDYLGLGTQPPTPSWGTLLNDGRVFLVRAPWLTVFPGLFIAATVLLLFLVGDGLRDLLDPTANIDRRR